MGGSDPAHYNTTYDKLYLRYLAARFAAFDNVWWSMANEWSQLHCYWKPAEPLDELCPTQRDISDPGCGYGGSNLPAWHTPVWDRLFQTGAYSRRQSVATAMHASAPPRGRSQHGPPLTRRDPCSSPRRPERPPALDPQQRFPLQLLAAVGLSLLPAGVVRLASNLC